ncbi:MOSC domain-containing protein [Euzebya sp.]|uniref:MOSC domain-containing protein n=1 Tax=Euzebya sp. TaxID=1971409 RepID=UPI003513771E
MDRHPTDHPAIVAVCRTRALQPRTASSRHLSGIDKGGVDAVVVTPTGVEGDEVRDVEHPGGIDKAVYAYADEDAAWWAAELGEDIWPGRFGENLRTRGVDLVGAVIGERWRIGADVLVEVSEPRVPCAPFQHHMGDRPGWVKRFADVGRTGTYLRVLAGGPVAPGDAVEVLSRPAHGVTIGRWFTANDPADAKALLDAESDDWQVPAALRGYIVHVLARAGAGTT